MLTKILHTSLERGCFPNKLKLTKVTLVFKKKDELNKENYHPVSVLFHSSKLFERIVFNQMHLFFESRFSQKPQHANALLNMIEKWNPLLIKAKRLRLYLWIYLKRLIHLSQFVTWLFFQYHKTYSKLFVGTIAKGKYK